MVGFDNGSEMNRILDGVPCATVNPDLTGRLDLTKAQRLNENAGLCFYGSQQKGGFDVSPEVAQQLLSAPASFGKKNSDVVKKAVNAAQVLRRTRPTWVIDFGVDMALDEAALYEAPFEYVKRVVYPERQDRAERRQRDYWWLHARPSPRFRRILATQERYIATPSVAKHRIFIWLNSDTLADHRLSVFARSDDYFFGVLHSRAHEVWSLHLGSTLEDRPCYVATNTFETYPFPWPPGNEPQDDPRVEAIAEAARELVEKRDRWLNPEGASEAELKKRTLTNLYNECPTWLVLAHEKLDRAVLDAYGWPQDLSDEELLERLLALNLKRSANVTAS